MTVATGAGVVLEPRLELFLFPDRDQAFKKYPQTTLRTKRDALEKRNRRANETAPAGETDASSGYESLV
jgi:hypothetical protein